MSAWQSYTCVIVALACSASWSASVNAAEGPGEHGEMHHGIGPPGTNSGESGPLGVDQNVDQRAPYGMPMHDDRSIFHLLMEQLEYRDDQGSGIFQWEGQA